MGRKKLGKVIFARRVYGWQKEVLEGMWSGLMAATSPEEMGSLVGAAPVKAESYTPLPELAVDVESVELKKLRSENLILKAKIKEYESMYG